MRRVPSFCLAVAFIAGAVPAGAQLPSRKYLPTGIATEMAVAAVDACRDKGEHVTAAVADSTGESLAIVRSDKARGQTVEMARNWARQGAHQMPPPRMQPVPRPPALNPNATEEQRRAAEEALRRAEEMQRRNDAQQRRQYGQPILVDGALIGVIAVAGAQDPQADLACAAAAIDTVSDKLK